jgi:hypothetical protein
MCPFPSTNAGWSKIIVGGISNHIRSIFYGFYSLPMC